MRIDRAFLQTPETFHLPAMIGVGDLPLPGQQVTHVADIAPAHRIGLARQTERAAPGLADLAERQVQVDDRVAGKRPARRLVDAHRPERQ